MPGEHVTKDAAVGYAGCEDAVWIDRVSGLQRGDQVTHKAYIVRMALQRISETEADIPGQHLRQSSAPCRGDEDPAFFLRPLNQVGALQHLLGVAPSAMKYHEQMIEIFSRIGRWHKDEIVPVGPGIT